ncbi:hypothetical protein SCAR479_13862 [Seiridium cardinale]|uniref:Uncharacterized protein n=2 Tax=Seiridium TaxID=138063 RepID=A0ABR2VAL3_9PEZI
MCKYTKKKKAEAVLLWL